MYIDNNEIIAVITDNYGRKFDLLANQVIWFRKPDFNFKLPEINCSIEEKEYISNEIKMTIENIYSFPNLKWINNPRYANSAKNKFQQLIAAKQIGDKYRVKIPETIMTNSSDIVINKCKEFNNMVVKPIYTGNITINGWNQGILTQKISNNDVTNNLNSIDLNPTCIQKYIDKKFELRVVVIGEKVFSIKIDSQKDERTKVDWRKYAKLCKHEIFELPKNIEVFCIEFMKNQKLTYGSIDFIVNENNEYYFLENNPFGQWLWLENFTNIPITKEFIEIFLGHSNPVFYY